MNAKELSTKEKIMSIAHEMFANRGFEAVSVRDICKAADVNISAINYHFENKFGLYVQILNWSVAKMFTELEEIAERNSEISLVEYTGAMFDFFLANKSHFRSSFKFFLSMSEVLQEVEVDCLQGDGPPGGEVLKKLILQEAKDVSEDDLNWAVRSLTSLVFHYSIIACNDPVLRHKKKYGITVDTLRSDIIRNAEVILKSLGS